MQLPQRNARDVWNVVLRVQNGFLLTLNEQRKSMNRNSSRSVNRSLIDRLDEFHVKWANAGCEAKNSICWHIFIPTSE